MGNKNINGDNWEFEPALESVKDIRFDKKYNHFINGEFVEPSSKKYFKTINPATGDVLSSLAVGNEKDIDLAVKSARSAYENTWSKLSGGERGKYIYRIARLMQERAKELALIESLDSGKVIKDAKNVDIPLACNHFFYYAGWADKLEYAFPNQKVESLGVVGQIIPWNFPLLMAAWKIAPALAAGNTVVLKPSETTSLSAMFLAQIIKDSGLPAGVVNIVTGAGSTGELLVNHNDINKVAFTGSTEVGKKIRAAISGSNKKLTLELGGKSANIVLDDAPIDQAIEGVVNGIFFNQGHVCCAGSRLLVQENIADIFIAKLKRRLNTLIVGNPLDKNSDIGAINSKEQLDKIDYYIQLGKEEGAEIFQSDASLPEKGFFCKPTLFLNVAQSNRINQEEIFGPVLTVQTFRTVDEAIQKANNSPYGLAAGVWSEKGSRVFNLTSKLKAGVVWANTYNRFDPSSPFGGVRESGYGREGGMQSLSAYLTVK